MSSTASRPRDLRVETEREPTNVATDAPRFAWRLPASERGAGQSAYRVQVARTREALDRGEPDCWDSGRVESDQSTGVAYDGVALASDETYHWRVRTWDEDGDATDWSEPSRFATALGGDADWAGEWIANQPGSGDANGHRSRWRPADEDATEWVQVDLGESRHVSTVDLHAAAPFDRVETPDGFVVSPLESSALDEPGLDEERIAGFGFPAGYRVAVADDPDFEESTVVAEVTDAENPGHGSATVDADATGRYVRVTATDLYEVDPARSQVKVDLVREEYGRWQVFALAGLSVRGGGTDLAVGGDVTASSAAETETWDPAYLVDGTGESTRPSSSPQLRTEVTLDGEVERARAHVAGLGYGELHVNGEKVGDAVLDPAWTEYDETVLYRTHDVTDLLAAGDNALGIWLGRGRFSKSTRDWVGFGSPRARLHLTVEYADGTTRTVGTGPDWTAAESPVVENDIYEGEVYDARREHGGWAEPGFDDADWESATVVEGPGGHLKPQRVEPMRVIETFDPVEVRDHEDGPIVDFGQNLTGWVELDVSGAGAGDEITISHAEALTEAGDLSTIDLRSADATDTYVADGDGDTYEPRFTYHGFRYAQVHDYPGDLSAGDLTAKAVTTAMDRRGEFDCSNEDLRQVQHNAVWGLRGNTHSIPEDCPQRDERFGWTGDAQITARALQFNFEAARFHGKWVDDHDDTQSPHGYVGDTVPYGFGSVPADPTWSVTRVVVPWYLYQHHGDRRALERNYEGMRRYVDFWHSLTEDGILPGEYGNYGDWLAFENRDGNRGLPFELFNTAFHYQTVDLLARAAAVLGNDADAERYRARAEAVADAFNERFLDDDGVYGPGTQSAYAVPLFLGMVPEDREAEVLDNLLEKIHDDGDRLMTGFLGTRPLLLTLVEHGHADLAYHIVSQPEQPGWVYMARQGATTMWEHWDSDQQVGSGMNSLNHSPFTFVSEWFYEALAGIRLDGAYDEGFEVAPAAVEDLDWVEATLDTRHGEVRSRWERTENGLAMEVTVPWNTTATVRVPAEGSDEIREGETVAWADGPATLPEGVTGAEAVADGVAFDVGAGTYRFAVER